MKRIGGNYLILIIAIGGIIASVFIGTISPGIMSVFQDHPTHDALAVDFPLLIDHKYKLKDLSGDAKVKKSSLQVFENSVIDPDQNCEFCSLLRYTPGTQEFAGIAYSSDIPVDLSQAKRLTVIVMGEDGGEKITLGIAGKKVEASGEIKYALKTKTITLTNDWVPIQIDLTKVAKKDLVDVTNPFGIEVLKSKANSNDVYFKYVTYDLEIAENPVATIATNGTSTTG